VLPSGKGLYIRTIDNAAKAMGGLLLERGGLGSVRRCLGQQGEEVKDWLAKIENDPERLEGGITFAGRVFKEGSIVAKVSCSSFPHDRGPVGAKKRVYKRVYDQKFLSLSHLARQDRAVKLVRDTKSKRNSKPWVLTAAEGARIEAAL